MIRFSISRMVVKRLVSCCLLTCAVFCIFDIQNAFAQNPGNEDSLLLAGKKKKGKKKRILIQPALMNSHGRINKTKPFKIKRGQKVKLVATPDDGYRAGIYVNHEFSEAGKDNKPLVFNLAKIKKDSELDVKFIPAGESFAESLNLSLFGLGNLYATTDENPAKFSGSAESDIGIKKITWRNTSNTTNGEIPIASEWEKNINLTSGENKLQFKIIAKDDTELTWDTSVVYYPDISFSIELKPEQDIAFRGEETDIRFHLGVRGLSNHTVVRLKQLDANGNPTGTMTPMFDNGTLPDEIASDGVFTAEVSIPTSGDEFLYYQAEISTQERTYFSQLVRIWVANHLEGSAVKTAVDLADLVKSFYDGKIQDGNSAQVADELSLAYVQSQDGVDLAGTDSQSGIWWVTSAGILGGYSPVKQGYKGSGIGGSKSGKEFSTPNLQPVTEDDNYIYSRRGLLISPYIDHPDADASNNIGADDDLFGPWGILPTSSQNCELAASSQIVNNGSKQVTLDSFKNVDSYGLIHISSHGDSFYRNAYWKWDDNWGPSDLMRGGISKSVIDTGVLMSKDNSNNWNFTSVEKDLLAKRIALGPNGTYFALPGFFAYYLESLPNSLVVLSSCRSLSDRSLADTFLAKGAGAVLGFSSYVSHDYAGDFISEMYTQLNAGKTVGQAFLSAQTLVGTENSGAEARILGENVGSLVFPSGTGIFNGGFEKSGIAPWTKDGDGRVLTQLGITKPTDGDYMGIISTGLGYSESSGSLEQDVCIDDNAETLSWKWNYFSEEFLEFCGSQFQDTFDVSVCEINPQTQDETCTSLFHKKVDDLCATHESKEIPLTPSDVSFDKGGAYYSGWLSGSISLQSYKGKNVIVKFAAGDVGDSIYDTAILIDEIKQE